MTFIELIPVVIAFDVFGAYARLQKIFYIYFTLIDNLALVSVINKQTSKSKRIIELVSRFVVKLKLNNVSLKPNIYQALIVTMQILLLVSSGKG